MHNILMSDLFAQSRVLAFGKTPEELTRDDTAPDLIAHKTMPGNQPSTTVLAPRLTPSVLGQLIALYEHQVFVEGIIYGIDSFDQWSVELGKAQALELEPTLSSENSSLPTDLDSSTASMIRWCQRVRKHGTSPAGCP